MVYAEIELINSGDQEMARRYIIGEEEVRSTRVKMMGAIPMEEMDLLIDPKRQQLILNPEYPYNGILRLGRSRPRDIS